MNSEIYEEDWAVYFTAVSENQVGTILVDLGLSLIAPVELKQNLFCLSIFINNPTEDGFASEEEIEVLNKIEDSLDAHLILDNKAVYAGRVHSCGKLQIYFYCENTIEIENVISKIITKYPNYHFEHNYKVDKDWTCYFEILYPSPIQMQTIQNERVINALEEEGDKLKKERLVEHWIYFQNEQNRENFLSSIRSDGFEIVSKKVNKNSKEKPYELIISRVDKVDYESVDNYVLYLWEKAQEFDGDYDGWETSVISD